ncbi:hypothetical protein TRL7639_01741 [Falsiruegeria litorea R37]|uniref:Uncharacterized protein n=1 Tax=Falsiruegeria litorea R37 TaxID=1200284 RepID=A0A1Y5SAE8_9RHOB|nr:hypothetical protein TRL7639_01741 [Falsiruegeria litorea R37]
MLNLGKVSIEAYLDEVRDTASKELIHHLIESQTFGVQPLKQQALVLYKDEKVGGYNKRDNHWFLRVKSLIRNKELQKRPWSIPLGFHWRNHPASNPHLYVKGPKAASVFLDALEHLFRDSS